MYYVDLAPDVSHLPMREANVGDGILLLVQGYVDLAPDGSHFSMREANVADGMLLLVRVMWIWRRIYLIDQ